MRDPRERTRNLYERVPGCPDPPLISLPDPDDIESLARELSGDPKKSLRFKILHAILGAVGFRKFQKHLTQDQLETLLRQTDLRRRGLCAPALSATVNLADDPRGLTPVERSATLIEGALQLYRAIQTGNFPPDKQGETPLEMGQYPNLFGTSIIWEGKRKPRVFKSGNMSHVTIVAGRRLYSLDVGDFESPSFSESLQGALGELIDHAKANPLEANEPSLGLLSSANARTQRKAFRCLEKDQTNQQTLEKLRHSFFTICLDLDHMPASDAEAAHIAQSENLCNRWHQSSLQLVVFGNAKACAIIKFDACIDGNTTMRGGAEIQKRAALTEVPTKKTPPQGNFPPVRELPFKIRGAHTQQAWRDVRTILDNQQSTFDIKNIGSRFFKHHQVDPVPAFVMALHMAIDRFTGKSARIEQLLTMSKYRCMGLTTAIVTNPEMTRFTEYMRRDDIQTDHARSLLMAAIETQKQDCRTARSDLPFSQLIPLFLNSLRGRQRIIKIVVAAAQRFLGIKWWSDVILSHPTIFPEATMVGRPGVRLPYINYFGLHYRLMNESIKLTIMPSRDWKVSNAEFISVLEKKLEQVARIINS